VISVENIIVLNVDKPHKDGKESESEIRMCDRMQICNIIEYLCLKIIAYSTVIETVSAV
jgi:hypothetical protein